MNQPSKHPEAHSRETAGGPVRFDIRAGNNTLRFLALIVGLPTACLVFATQTDITGLLLGITVAAALVLLSWTHLRAVIEIADGKLTVRYNNQVFCEQLKNLRVASDRKLDFESDPAHGIDKSIIASRIKGFNVGWFRLRDDSVAFACLSRKRRARAIETRDGYVLLLDPGVARRIQRFIGNSKTAAAA